MSSVSSVMPRLSAAGSRSDRMDRLDWRAGTCFDSYGLRVGVRFNQPALLERLEPHLPPGWRPRHSHVVDEIFSLWLGDGEGHRGLARVYAGTRRRAATRDLGEAFLILESEIRQSVAAAARRRTFVHAGVVSWRGRAIVVPGRSRSGKTSLVAALVRAGADYLSDEFAVLDRRGRVHPFLKPLSIRGENGCDRHARRLPVSELGGSVARGPLPIGLVVLSEYRRGAAWRPTRLTAGQAVLEMLAHTVPARLRPEESLVSLERSTARAVVLKGERGEAHELAPQLLESLDAGESDSRPSAGGGR
jgi:hypothetical protein